MENYGTQPSLASHGSARGARRPLDRGETPVDRMRGSAALHAGTQMADKLGLRHRLCKQIALPDLATDGLQLVALMHRFDALRDGPQTEAAAELDNRLTQTCIEMVNIAVGDVAAIDLELAERQLLQPHKRGITGAEIVDRQIAFEFTQ